MNLKNRILRKRFDRLLATGQGDAAAKLAYDTLVSRPEPSPPLAELFAVDPAWVEAAVNGEVRRRNPAVNFGR